MLTVKKASFRRAKRRDRIARWIITLGGVMIIASVIGIVLLIVSVTFPLFRPARSEVKVATTLPSSIEGDAIRAIGVDRVELGEKAEEDSVTAFVLTEDGTFTFLDFSGSQPTAGDGENAGSDDPTGKSFDATVLATHRADPPAAADDLTVIAARWSGGSSYCLRWSDGSVSLVEINLAVQFDDSGVRTVTPGLRTLASLPPEGDQQATDALACRSGDEGDAVLTCVKLLSDNRLVVIREVTVTGILGNAQKEQKRSVIDQGIPGRVTAFTINEGGTRLFAGTENGCLVTWQFNDQGQVIYHEVVPAFRDKRSITALAMVFGDVSIAVGDEKGGLAAWLEVRTESSRKLRRVHPLLGHQNAVRHILPSLRNKTLLSLGEGGLASLDYTTSESHLLTLELDKPLTMVGYAPRGNAVIGLDEDHNLVLWNIDSPHPEISWNTLFSKVHYDNHDEPKRMWQSSGTDEPKFSLVPVIFGTMKSTFYAMLFAVPLALFSAIYVSHFTMPAFKRMIKPVVEIMAAVPTVVIGFLVLLWFAPLMGNWIVAVFTGILTLPVTFVVFMTLWQTLRRFDSAKRIENGYEFIALVPVICLGGALAIWLAAPVENMFFDGDFQQWLFGVTETPYDPLNSVVVAFGLGFAVIPIIFSISEDSLSDIPYDLTAASLALGASRWQTVWRVVLPSASPGIFAAIMIGFGRAVGETMIVFMATGNTPITDWNPFNGFRTLSANIAVEISEAPRDGTLYRVLFLCAVLLFLLTFLLNTAAELVRHRLRKKYARY